MRIYFLCLGFGRFRVEGFVRFQPTDNIEGQVDIQADRQSTAENLVW